MLGEILTKLLYFCFLIKYSPLILILKKKLLAVLVIHSLLQAKFLASSSTKASYTPVVSVDVTRFNSILLLFPFVSDYITKTSPLASPLRA